LLSPFRFNGANSSPLGGEGGPTLLFFFAFSLKCLTNVLVQSRAAAHRPPLKQRGSLFLPPTLVIFLVTVQFFAFRSIFAFVVVFFRTFFARSSRRSFGPMYASVRLLSRLPPRSPPPFRRRHFPRTRSAKLAPVSDRFITSSTTFPKALSQSRFILVQFQADNPVPLRPPVFLSFSVVVIPPLQWSYPPGFAQARCFFLVGRPPPPGFPVGFPFAKFYNAQQFPSFACNCLLPSLCDTEVQGARHAQVSWTASCFPPLSV